MNQKTQDFLLRALGLILYPAILLWEKLSGRPNHGKD